jgi:pilus assembly protein CpaB
MRRLALPLMALLLAGTSVLAVRAWQRSRQQVAVAAAEAPPVPRKAVLVAAADLPAGSFVRAEQLRWQEWPEVATPESYVVEGSGGPADLEGTVLRRPMVAGEPVLTPNLVKPGDRGFLAAVLDPGMRGVSVPIDEASGNAGLIFPGDRVDLILTQTLTGQDQATGPRRVSETILEDVRVIAMGRRLRNEEGDEGTSASQIRTTTLETTPEAAERVALVTELGKLSLSLRSLAVAEASASGHAGGRRATWDVDVSPALRAGREPSHGLLVVRGSKLEAVEARQGAGS